MNNMKNSMNVGAVAIVGIMCQSISLNAYAQNFRVEIGTPDQRDFICDVAKIADDLTARDLGGRSSNFWTKTARGGKFEATEPTKVRVASSAPEVARRELFAFYQKNAALVRGTFPDKGQQPIDSVVKACVPDPSSTRGVKVTAVSDDKYKVLVRDKDHLLKFVALNTTQLSEEQLVGLFNPSAILPSDAFERKAFYQKESKRLAPDIAAAEKGPFILEGEVKLRPYDFNLGQFEILNLIASAESYGYTYDMNARVFPQKPIYKLSSSTAYSVYKPRSIEEAKKIEAARSKDGLKLRTFVQPVKAWLNGDKPEIDGVITKIEVASMDGKILFSMPAK
jgi:hypothetical protein